MLRPYFAVVKDSFRAAVANKVLYVVIALVTLFLAALFPFGISEKLASTVRQNDIVDAVSLSRRMVDASKSDESSPARQLWDRMDEDAQQRLLDVYDSSGIRESQNSSDSMEQAQNQGRSFNEVIRTMNDVLDDRDFYDEDAWANYSLDEETKELLEIGTKRLNDEQLARLNRLLLNAGFAREMNPGPPTSISFYYAFWDMPGAIPIRKRELPTVFNIAYWLDKLVLSIGVFVAILVTAPVIPQTLEPGSLNLLLSKPVNRWTLFISKYLGACAFTIVFSSYLFIGLWMFFGMRLGIWDSALLFCIPIYVLVFAIYFAVSAFAGVVFRNTIVSVVLSILFWMLCFSVGTLHGLFDGINQNYEIRQVVVAGDEVFQIDRINVPYRWNAEEQKWDPSFMSETTFEVAEVMHYFGGDEVALPPMFGPIYDDKNERLITAQTSMMFMGSPITGEHLIGVGRPENDWDYEESFALPQLSVNLFIEPDGDIIAVTRLGTVHRLNGDLEELMEEYEAQQQAASLTPVNGEDAATDMSPGGAGGDQASMSDQEMFVEVGPSPPLDFSQPAAIAQHPKTGELVCYSRGDLEFVEIGPDGKYVRGDKSALTLPGPKDISAKLWYAGSTLIVARGNGEIFRIDRPTLEVQDKFEPESQAALKSLVGSNDGRWFALVFDNGNLWVGDNNSSESKLSKVKVRGQGGISAAAFTDNGSLWAADRIDRLRRYDLEKTSLEETIKPALGVSGFLYRWVLIPVYVVCPKPGEFYRLVAHLTADDTSDEEVERRVTQERNPWEPLWNGLIFIGVMLSLGCLYLERQDF